MVNEAEVDRRIEEAKREVWQRAAAIAQEVYDGDRSTGAPALDVKHRIEEEAGLAREVSPPVSPQAVPPIEIIDEYLKDRGWDDMRFWQETGIVLNDIRRGWLKVGPEQAHRIARALGRPEEFWLNLQRAYDAARGGDRISYWVERIHTLATSKGWWDQKTQKELDADHLLSAVALMHVELSNQLERVRTGAETVSHPSIDMNAVFGDVAGLTDEQRSTLAKLALIHSEISEAVECVLLGKEEMYFVDGKPEGAVVELIDGVIRSFDLAGRKGWDVEGVMRAKHSYNETRPYRHGGKRA